jgi:hypothetical protein
MAFIAFVLVAAAGLFYWAASYANHGNYWADRICNEAQTFCDKPHWLLLAAGIAILIASAQSLMKDSN